MRVALAHDQVVAEGIELAALVAGDDACGNTGSAHEHREGGRVVLAESAARFEQELVHRIVVQQRRGQRVDERLLAKIAECPRDDGCRVFAERVAPARGQLPGSGMHTRRQGERCTLLVDGDSRQPCLGI